MMRTLVGSLLAAVIFACVVLADNPQRQATTDPVFVRTSTDFGCQAGYALAADCAMACNAADLACISKCCVPASGGAGPEEVQSIETMVTTATLPGLSGLLAGMTATRPVAAIEIYRLTQPPVKVVGWKIVHPPNYAAYYGSDRFQIRARVTESLTTAGPKVRIRVLLSH